MTSSQILKSPEAAAMAVFLVGEVTDQSLRLRDTVLGVFRAPNTITHSAHLHQTMVTKDGAQIERHIVHTHSQKE